MKRQQRMHFLSKIDFGTAMSVMWRVGLDLLFKFICYFLVYKFYVYIKPKFCRKPVLPKPTPRKQVGNEKVEKVNTDDWLGGRKTEKIPTMENKLDDLDNLEEDEFVKAADKFLEKIKSRNSYAGSKTNERIRLLHKRWNTSN